VFFYHLQQGGGIEQGPRGEGRGGYGCPAATEHFLKVISSIPFLMGLLCFCFIDHYEQKCSELTVHCLIMLLLLTLTLDVIISIMRASEMGFECGLWRGPEELSVCCRAQVSCQQPSF